MPQQPWVLALTGAPGSGKSTTARELARTTGAAILDQDSMTNPLVDVVAGLIGANDYDDARLTALVRAARYSCLTRVAADCLAAGLPAILVAPFTAERHETERWSQWESEIAAAGGRAVLGWLRLDAPELRRRIVERGLDRDVAKLADLDAYLSTLDLGPPRVPHIVVSAAQTPEEQARQLRSALA